MSEQSHPAASPLVVDLTADVPLVDGEPFESPHGGDVPRLLLDVVQRARPWETLPTELTLRTHSGAADYLLTPEGELVPVEAEPAPRPLEVISRDGGPRPVLALPPRMEQSATEPLPHPVPMTRAEAKRHSFLAQRRADVPAQQGWRGVLTRLGLRIEPSEEELAERAAIEAVAKRWSGPRTIAVVNGKGGAGKTPTTLMLAAAFARFSGAGVLAWDNNQTRGTLGWRTEQDAHDATLLDMLPQAQRLLGMDARLADLAEYVHHQKQDKYDVLRSQPMALAHQQRLFRHDVDAIHAVAGKYYRVIVMDSGNDESDPMWRRMVELADHVVVATTTRDDHAEAGALLIEALADGDEHTRALAASSTVVVTQADPRATAADVERIVSGYRNLAREVAHIPYDRAMVDGILRYGNLRRSTQRAWLRAASAVAAGL